MIKRVSLDENSHGAADLGEEVPEVGGGGGEDHPVGVEGAAPAARQRHVHQVAAPEDVSRQPGNGFIKH